MDAKTNRFIESSSEDPGYNLDLPQTGDLRPHHSRYGASLVFPLSRSRSAMELLTAIETRSSAGRLAAPGPTQEQLERMLAAAGRAPDHGRLRPWRLIVLEGA